MLKYITYSGSFQRSDLLRIFVSNVSKYVLTAIFLISFVSGSVQAESAQADGYWQGTLGPLNIRSMGPGQALRLAPLPRSPYGLPEGQTEIQFNIAGASVYLFAKDKYLIDFNFTDTSVALNHGLGDGWSAELSFNDRRIVNLYFDEIVVAFHDAFGLEQNGRDVNMNESHVRIPQYGVSLDKELNGIFSQSFGLTVQKVLIDKNVQWPALAVIANLSIETLSDGFIEKDSIDYGMQLSLAQKSDLGYWYANLSYTKFDSDTTLDVVPLADDQWSGMLGYEFTVSSDQAFIVQYLFSEGVIEDLGALDKVSHEIHLGYKWRTETSIFEAGVVENIVNFDNGPDVAFTFGITHRL